MWSGSQEKVRVQRMCIPGASAPEAAPEAASAATSASTASTAATSASAAAPATASAAYGKLKAGPTWVRTPRHHLTASQPKHKAP